MLRARRLARVRADSGLLLQAFTHPSFHSVSAASGTLRGSLPNNQRLEFLGDAVLQLASADYLFHHLPERHEGQLSYAPIRHVAPVCA